VQRRAIDRWARDPGPIYAVTVEHIFQDVGVFDEEPLERRAGLVAALTELAGIEDAGLVVYRLDRLHPDVIMQAFLEAEVRRLGGRVFSTMPSESATFGYDQRQALTQGPQAASPAYQRSIRALRLRVGRELKHRSGGYAYGAPPTGYRAEGGQLVPDPAGQRILERARELRAGGASLRVIAAVLTSEGYPTRRGGRWQPTQVTRLLKRGEAGARAPT
jgi:DNA invertase Pin-like site-specific DNA recombinase